MSDGWSWEEREYRTSRVGSRGSRERESPRSPSWRYPARNGSDRAVSCSKESSRSSNSASAPRDTERSYEYNDRDPYAFDRDSRYRRRPVGNLDERHRDHPAVPHRASSPPEELLPPRQSSSFARGSRGAHEHERQPLAGPFPSRYTDGYTQPSAGADQRQARKQQRSPPSSPAGKRRPIEPEQDERRPRPWRGGEEEARPQPQEGRKRQRQDHPEARTSSADPRGHPRSDRASPPVRASQASAPPTDPRRRPRPSPRTAAGSPRGIIGSTAAASSPREVSGARSPASSSGADRGGAGRTAAADPRKNPWAAVLDIAPDDSFQAEEPVADVAESVGEEVRQGPPAAAERETLPRREVKREPEFTEPPFARRPVGGAGSGSENGDRGSSSNSSTERGRARRLDVRGEVPVYRGNGDVEQPAPLSLSIAGVTLGGRRAPPPPHEMSAGSGVHVRLPLHGRPALAHQDSRSAPGGPNPHEQHPRWHQQVPGSRGSPPPNNGAVFDPAFAHGNPASQAPPRGQHPAPPWPNRHHSRDRSVHHRNGSGNSGEDVGFHQHHLHQQQDHYHLPVNNRPMHPGRPPPPSDGGQHRRSAYAAAMHNKREYSRTAAATAAEALRRHLTGLP
ncbi:unnamed protein product [Scytosiphon promiscuus]